MPFLRFLAANARWLAGGFLLTFFLLPVFLVPLAGACFAVADLSAPWTIFVVMGLLGLFYGFSNTLFGALCPEIYGTRHLGAIRPVTVAAGARRLIASPGAID